MPVIIVTFLVNFSYMTCDRSVTEGSRENKKGRFIHRPFDGALSSSLLREDLHSVVPLVYDVYSVFRVDEDAHRLVEVAGEVAEAAP
jgi:hypothetical protein